VTCGLRRSWSKDKRSHAHDVLDMKGNKAADHVRGIIEAMHATELRLYTSPEPFNNHTWLR